MSLIEQFYAQQNIFITGATGFLGRILTEKLLRSCPDIGTIFLLIRSKKGKSVQERIDALLADSVFDVLRIEYPDFAKKIVGLPGDIGEQGLGLSSTDHERLTREVSVIFHVAATVRFNETLDRALNMNVNSTKCIVNIAKECKNLKVGIYVSTAYSNCVRKSIDEKFYPPPLSYEEASEVVADIAKNKFSEHDMKTFTETLIGDWPNTYSFSKAIAEGVVAEFAKELPFGVFRPSIVMNTYREPIPGWLSGPLGMPGTMLATGLGIVHAIQADDSIILDIVPVDYVCNALISCAWEVGTTDRRHVDEIPVYNYVSGEQNPVTLKQLYATGHIMLSSFPMNSAVYYPSWINVKSIRLFSILEFFLHLIPALMIDFVARLFGKQPIFYKQARKIGVALRALGYFATQEWKFGNQRIQNLWNRTGHIDKQIFPFNIAKVDWDEHSMKMVKGLRKYLVGESEDNLKQARRRYLCLFVIHVIVRLIFWGFVLWITWKVLGGDSFSKSWVQISWTDQTVREEITTMNNV